MKKKWILVAAGILILGVGGIFALRNSDPYGLHAAARREWKDRATAEIARLSGDSTWVKSEIASLKTKATNEPPDYEAWLSDHLILMKNGDWIAYASICRKQDSGIHDIFIGRGSDGKWYYSTFHFCVRMITLKMESDMDGQPESLPKFVAAHFLREFDGRSDECLQKTWPPKRR